MKIVLLKSGTEVGTIAASVPIGTGGKGSYTWPIYYGTPGSDFKVSVQSISKPTIKDVSNNYFTITTTTPASSITVTSPNGGETWQRYTSHAVTWDYTGSPGSYVKIVLLKSGNEVGTIAASVPVGTGGKGSYTWPIYYGTPGSDFKVSVQSISQPAIKDVSNNYFTLTPAGTSTPTITLSSPNGGENWQWGTSHTITWDYSGNPGSAVKIVLLKGSTEVGTISASTSIGSGGHGSYSWLVPSTGVTGSDYKVSVQSISQPVLRDTSNNYLTLTSGPLTPVITGTGGTISGSGTTTTITSTTPSGKTLSMDTMASYNLPAFTFGPYDESAKVQSAINYAVANNYAIVQFPTGGKSISIGTKLNFPKTTASGINITYIGNSCTLRMMAENFGHDVHYVNMYGKVTGMIFDGDRSYLAGVPKSLGGPGTTGENGVMMFSNSEMDGCIVRNFCAYTVSVFQVPGQTNIKITNNTIYNSWRSGICSGAGDPPPAAPFNSAITITGNRIYNCAEVGIKIRGVRGSTVSNNIVTVGSQYGMASSASGIELYSDDGPNYNTVIDHNTINGVGGYSIGIESDSGGTNQNIAITNNVITDCYVNMRLPNISGLTKPETPATEVLVNTFTTSIPIFFTLIFSNIIIPVLVALWQDSDVFRAVTADF